MYGKDLRGKTWFQISYILLTVVKLKNQNPPKAPFLPASVPAEPAQNISMNLLDPLKKHPFILTVIDHFSRHLELYNLNEITANAVTKSFLSYISTHGKPNVVLTEKVHISPATYFMLLQEKWKFISDIQPFVINKQTVWVNV